MQKICCGDGRHHWAVGAITTLTETTIIFECQAPDYFRDDRGDGKQGMVKSPWTSVIISIRSDLTAEIVFEGDHLDDGENGGKQVWQALVYRRDDEMLVMNYETDEGLWYCRITCE
jgi:hypothetical protein